MGLRVDDLTVAYGSVVAVRSVSLEVGDGEIRTILGPNGAGKSTLVRAILGVIPKRSGQVFFPSGRDVSRMPPHDLHRLGIAWVPEGREVFGTLTVQENLLIGGYPSRKEAIRLGLDRAFELFPQLWDRRNAAGSTLSGGEQQMLAIARALMSRPRLILMDEPSLGLAPRMADHMFETIQTINRQGTAVLMVEQNARQALRIASWAYLLEGGEVIRQGPAAELTRDEVVQRAYFGG